MTIPFQKGRYVARFADGAADILTCQKLRYASFFDGKGVDVDRFDAVCRHMMVEDAQGRLVATLRLFAGDAQAGYAAQYYDLRGFAGARTLEIGRFCIAPDVLDADILRVVWGALTRLVDDQKVRYLFGCSSFAGVDPRPYASVFARLMAHIGLLDVRKTQDVVALVDVTGPGAAPMPSLLRTYLAMGGWVSDHVVVDHALQTMHLFTCVDVAAVPVARARALRALA